MSTLELSSLYSSGDIILQNPIESSAIFLVVVVMCSCIEYLFALAGEVDSKFFRQMFDTIAEEVLVVGSLSLLLTFGSSVIQSLPSSWSVMFQWAHICLLFMGIMFVVLLVLVLFFVFSGNSRWKKFESTGLKNGLEGVSLRQRDFAYAIDKFNLALRAFGFEAGEVTLSSYLLKAEKRNLISLGNLSWKSWLALSTIVVLNALRTKVITRIFPDPDPYNPDIILDETGNVVNVASFIVICGYGTLLIFLAIHRRMQRRFRQYLMLSQTKTRVEGNDLAEPINVTKLDLDDPQSFLLWQSTTNSITLIQAVLMFLVWYSAVFFLNMVYQTFTFNIGFTLLFLVTGIVPLIVFVVVAPWTLTAIAILSTLGTNLNENWVKSLIQEKNKLESIAAEKERDEKKAKETEKAKEKSKPGDAEVSAAIPSKQTAVVIKPPRPLAIDEAALSRLAAHHSVRRGREGSP
jgi:hypothetical protein